MKNKECKYLKEVLKKTKKNIDFSFFIMLILFTQVIFTDTLIYFSGVRYIIANAIALIGNLAVWGFLIWKKIIKIENNFNKWDIIFLVIFIIGTCATIILGFI